MYISLPLNSNIYTNTNLSDKANTRELYIERTTSTQFNKNQCQKLIKGVYNDCKLRLANEYAVSGNHDVKTFMQNLTEDDLVNYIDDRLINWNYVSDEVSQCFF